MAQDFDELFFDFENMTDDEVYDVVLQQLNEYPNIDPGWIEVAVKDGFVTVSGRVGTDSEKQVVEKIIVETMGGRTCSNEVGRAGWGRAGGSRWWRRSWWRPWGSARSPTSWWWTSWCAATYRRPPTTPRPTRPSSTTSSAAGTRT